MCVDIKLQVSTFKVNEIHFWTQKYIVRCYILAGSNCCLHYYVLIKLKEKYYFTKNNERKAIYVYSKHKFSLENKI